jgi:uncharacterized membrane protein
MFKTYDATIRKIIAEKTAYTDWEKILKHHHIMIGRIQHERLIHLMVTIFVGLVLTLSSFTFITSQNFILLMFILPLLALFVAYLFHYRFLENTTQGWYEVEEQIRENI